MMKQVKELKEKALAKAREQFIPGPYPNEDPPRWQALVDEEFAKLVVYECIDMVASYREGDEILDHFGIVDRSRF